MKCSNCADNATYEYRLTQTKSIPYCGKHLPKFLEARRNAGNLKITPVLTETLDSAIAALAPSTSEEPKVEEPVVEAPKKKATKKKAE